MVQNACCYKGQNGWSLSVIFDGSTVYIHVCIIGGVSTVEQRMSHSIEICNKCRYSICLCNDNPAAISAYGKSLELSSGTSWVCFSMECVFPSHIFSPLHSFSLPFSPLFTFSLFSLSSFPLSFTLHTCSTT